MDNTQALTAVIDRVSASGKPVRFGFDELQEWQDGLLASFVKARLLVKDVQTQSLECTGCEHGCFMPVYYADDQQRAFIVCDEPSMQDQMGRIAVSLPRLQQWQASAKQLAAVIADLLGVETKPSYHKESACYKLGMLKGDKGRRGVSLAVQPLALVINQQSVALGELLHFEDDQLVIDDLRIAELLNLAPDKTGRAYTPDVSKREAQKATTQAMYQDWQDAYNDLKIKHPKHNISWICRKIAVMPIAKNKDADYIRRQIKP